MQTQTEEPAEEPEEATEYAIPDGAEAAVMLFMSPKIDMFIMMHMPEWTYSTETIPGQVFFYPPWKPSGETGVSFSSQDDGGDPIDAIWENVAASFTEAMPGFEYQQEAEVSVGEYTANRYSFTSDWFFGDYFFWKTDDKLFICSFTAQEDEYEDLLIKLLASLETFQVLSDMQE